MSKKILFVMPGLNGGGAERVVVQIASMFADNIDCAVKIILTEDKTCVYPLNSNIEIEYIGTQMPSPFKQIKFIRYHVNKWKNCNVISFLDNQNIFTAIALLGKNNNFIVSERNAPKAVSIIKRVIKNLFYCFADYVVFQTEEAMKFYSKSIQKKGLIIANPINNNLPVPYRGVRRKTFVAYSRLTTQKNIPMMLKAFQEFHKKIPEYVLNIYGKGPLENELKELTIKMGLEQCVYFMGFSENVHQLIIDATAYLSSSDYEGISNSMLEAMAIGLPVICTDCPAGGARKVIESGINGILVPVGDYKAMAEAMLFIVREKEKAILISEKAVEVRNSFTLKKIFMQWEKLVNG